MFDLPLTPAPRTHDPYLIEFGEVQTPFLGGEEQKVARLGSRFGVKCELPRMTYEQAMPWIAALLRGELEEVTLPFRQPGFDPGDVPNQTVNGPHNANTNQLAVNGNPAHIRPGQFFNILKGNRRYLHNFLGLLENGKWLIAPLTRVSLGGGEQIIIADPTITGFIPKDKSWNVDRAITAGLSFEIKESK